MTLVGREDEVAFVDAMLDRVGERGGALVVRGEAGVGKSALLDSARRAAHNRGLTTLTTTGVQSEAHVAFAGLHHLLRPTSEALDALAPPQRAAMEAAFGITDSAAADFFLIALASLDVLSELASRSPLLLVIEDAHWLDAATADVLAFVARRLEFEPIVVLFAAREGFAARVDQGDLPELRLEALGPAASARLLDAVAPDLAPALRQRVLDEARGNPLALIELPQALGSGLDASPITPLPLTERLERSFAAQISDLPEATRTLLLVAALDDGGDLKHIVEAASAITGEQLGVPELSAAETTRAVSVVEGGLLFRHPLVRSAVYQGTLPPQRQIAHAALADAYRDDPDRSVWHRAASLDTPDDTIAAELESAAQRALRRGAPSVAAAAFERAARLATSDEQRGRLLMAAVLAHYELGHGETIRRLLHDAQQLELSDADRANLLFLMEIYGVSPWTGGARLPAFVAVAEQLHDAGNDRAAIANLTHIAMRCWWGNIDAATRESVVSIVERLELPPADPMVVNVLGLSAPVSRGALVAERLAENLAAGITDPAAALMLAEAAAAVWAEEEAFELSSLAAEGFRASGRLGLLAVALVNQAWAGVHLGKTRSVITAAEESTRLTVEIGETRWTAAAMLTHAAVAAERGDTPEAERLASEADELLVEMGANPLRALVQFVRGRAAIAEQRFADAYEQFHQIFDPVAVPYHPYVRITAVADLVDTAVHGGGDVDEAGRYLAELDSLAATTRSSFLRAQLAFARPLLAASDQAESLFVAGLEGDLQRWPCYRGRAELAYGEWLRRRRRLADARAPLRKAEATFDALGFVRFAERARQELRATGETVRKRTPDAWAQLTPQELQIAQMAATGLSNREIGQRLYLSHRTVAYHLYRIFPKLGISARSELRDVISEQVLAG